MKQYFRMYKKHPKAVALRILVTTAAALTVLVLFSLVFYILIKGIPNLKPSLFEWKYTSKNASMMPAIINTITMVLMTLLIAVPFVSERKRGKQMKCPECGYEMKSVTARIGLG